MSERIIDACNTNGFYTLSAGTLDPLVVLTRLLDNLALLDPQSHEVITAADGQYACIPRTALEDAQNEWWNTDAAQVLLERIIAAINAAAPEGYVCTYRAGDCLVLAKVDMLPPASGAPSVDPSAGVLAPNVSAVRARVRDPR